MEVIAESHVDHGLTKAQLDWLVERFADRKAFFIETVELPSELGTVPCGLFGPVMGDAPVPESEVSYETRGTRQYTSRLVKRDTRPTNKVTVIAGPHGESAVVLYTAFGGPLAPKEPGDTTLAPEKLEESRSFWAEHALAV